MEHAEGTAVMPCRNCSAVPPVHAHYCAQCGQETALHPPTFGEFVHEFVGHYVALEGALWRTLALLLARPGRLTREYLDGRRKKYVLPLRLYLTISFVFFLAMKMFAASAPDPIPQALPPSVLQKSPELKDPKVLKAESVRNNARLNAMAPYVMFLLLPVFAAIMQLAWRTRGMTYGEHFVFSLHVHSFGFIAFLVLDRLPDAFSDGLFWILPLYAVLAMREVYGARWPATLGRAAVVFVLYVIALAAALLGTLLVLKYTK